MTHVFITLLLLILGVYYPVSVLPSILAEIVKFSPATYALEATRKALLEGMPTDQLFSIYHYCACDGSSAYHSRSMGFRLAELYAKCAGKLHRDG